MLYGSTAFSQKQKRKTRMNSVSLIGRLTRDPDVRYTGETAVARFALAVARPKQKDKEATSDFPNIVAFGKTAELIEKYTSKGRLVGITGRIQTGNYTDKDGKKVYTTDVVAERIEFLDKPEKKEEPKSNIPLDGFEQISTDEIPF